jgi:hypothetical protein
MRSRRVTFRAAPLVVEAVDIPPEVVTAPHGLKMLHAVYDKVGPRDHAYSRPGYRCLLAGGMPSSVRSFHKLFRYARSISRLQ